MIDTATLCRPAGAIPHRQFLWALLALLAANLLLGTGQLVMMPPFEGLDETAHYSRLKSHAFNPGEQNLPLAQQEKPIGRMTAEVFAYYHNGPMPYLWIVDPTMHQFAAHGVYDSYRAFFAQRAKVERYIEQYRHTPATDEYNPGPEPNWQYQHPGLYYHLFAPAMRLAAGLGLSLIAENILLRWLSYCAAFLGFAIGVFATWRHLAATGVRETEMLVLLGAFYPFITPIYFFEFARLGNDGLCLFWCGVAWALLLGHLRNDRNIVITAMLGLVLGLGILTKALMMPVAAGMMAFLLAYHWQRRASATISAGQILLPVCLVGILACTIGMLGYINHAGRTMIASELPGSLEFSALLRDPAKLLSGFFEHFSLSMFLNGVVTILSSSVWGYATWSHRLSADSGWSMIFLAVTTGIAVSYLRGLRGQTLTHFSRLPLWLLLPIACGLMAHHLLSIALYGSVSTPGRYLHIAAPAFMLMMAFGLKRLLQSGWGPVLRWGFFGIAGFNIAMIWPQMTLFGGCSDTVRGQGNAAFLVYPDAWFCLNRAGKVIANLGVLAWPQIGLLCFAAAGILLFAALHAMRPFFAASPAEPATAS